MYRFFSGIAGRKDVGKSLVTFQDVLPPSFSRTSIALSRARAIHGAPLNAKMQNRDVRPSYARRSSVPCVLTIRFCV